MARLVPSWFIRLSVVAVAVAGVAWLVRPTPILVDTATVARGTLESTVTAEGKTRVRNLFVVTAPVDGELERITLKAGDIVAPTTVVAHLRPVLSRPLDPRSRAEAEAAVVAARAGVQRAEAAYREAVAALTHAESTSETSARLAREGVTAPKDAEHAAHDVEIRRQSVKVTQSAIEQASGELARAEAVAATSGSNSARSVTDVFSPTAGRVLRVLRESLGTVVAGTPLLEIGNTAGLEVSADFLTTDAIGVRPGARAMIRDWGGDRDLNARVRHVEPGAFTKVSALGLEEQRVPIVLDFLSDPPGFGNDFHVRVSIVVWTGSDVLTVPSTALFRVGDEWGLFVIRDSRARLTRVAAGHSDGERTVIERGVNEGDEVVIQPSDTLADGARVRRLAGSN